MITLYRKYKLWTLKTKWELELWKFIDKQVIELINDPEELSQKFMPYLTELIHKSNNSKN